ncbi:uncharacterized protein LOC129600567 isoform X2 [Paramacrobiotus metropolitanus]|uniref:uncharacterized protein LOC129600567 isoform X2 n=1 Tax=Paramacrobiotus metropolitanus TaxID=2943436 RepID=UPI0024461691|nr:uncharacterized protein LOC129600567 isoform X2 [Paramacrobiotus metropolitanus]
MLMMHKVGYRLLLFCLCFGTAYCAAPVSLNLTAPSFSVPYGNFRTPIFFDPAPAPTRPVLYYPPAATFLPDATEIILDKESGTNCVFVTIKLWDEDYLSAAEDFVQKCWTDKETTISLIPFTWISVEYSLNNATRKADNSSWQPMSAPMPPTVALCVPCSAPAACNETRTAIQSDSARFASHLSVSFATQTPGDSSVQTHYTVTANTGKNVSDTVAPLDCANTAFKPDVPLERLLPEMVTVHWQSRRANNLWAFSDSVIRVTLLGADNQPFNKTNVTTSHLTGEFTLTLPRTANYSILFETSGFSGISYAPIILRNFTHLFNLSSEIFMEPLLFIDRNFTGSGKAGGAIRLVNTSGAYSASGIEVQLRAGLNNFTGPVAATTTSKNGTWSVTLPAGLYTATVTDPNGNFTAPPFTVVPGSESLRDWAMTPQFAKGDIRIVLRGTGFAVSGNFGPYDLKLSVSGPLQNNTSQRAEVRGNATASADNLMVYDYVDRIFGSVLIRKQLPGVYRIQVYEADAILPKPTTRFPEWNLANSQSMVEVYRGDLLWAQYFVPIKSGNTWTVAEINGTQINAVNDMQTVPHEPTKALQAGPPPAVLEFR